MKTFYGVKLSKTGNELLEVVNAETERDARKYLAIKYMNIALSCRTSLAVVKKAEYEKLCVA